jgi:hypothetical protein
LNAKVTFVLQPFSPWTKRDLTEEEKKVFEYLDKLQQGSKWETTREKLDHSLYESIVGFFSSLAEKKGVGFVDSNIYFDQTDKNLFVDSVHLTDAANKMAAKLIYNVTKGEE